jgi:hypothetical protein
MVIVTVEDETDDHSEPIVTVVPMNNPPRQRRRKPKPG